MNRRPTTPRRRIETLIGHLELIATALEIADQTVKEQEDQAAWGNTTQRAESTISTRHISDPTGTRATSPDLAAATEQRHALNRAITNTERAITHLRHETSRACGTSNTDTSGERRCPEMVLIQDSYGVVLRACGALTHSWQRPDFSTAWRQDGRCVDHGIEHDRLADESNSRRLRKHRAS